MSMVRCEYCDSVFEYTGQHSCPACGASLGGNRRVEELRLEAEESAARAAALKAETEERARQVFQENMERTGRMGRFVTAFFIFVFITILIGFLITFFTGFGFFSRFGGVFS